MKKWFQSALLITLFFSGLGYSQDLQFRTLPHLRSSSGVTEMVQDKLGYVWICSQSGGLQQLDGKNTIAYINDPANPRSIGSGKTECLGIDSIGFIWVGLYGTGLDKFDPVTKQFFHFRHDSQNPASLANDTVTAILIDHLGNLWLGTYGGLDRFDRDKNLFIHYPNISSDPTSLSYPRVRTLYEDRKGDLWVGCGTPFLVGDPEDGYSGGLNKLNRLTGKFTRYMYEANNNEGLRNNKVTALYEDTKGNFWVGTGWDHLHLMDRNTGRFTEQFFLEDSLHHGHFAYLQPPIDSVSDMDHIRFINQDVTGALWIGTFMSGVFRVDFEAGKSRHFGALMRKVRGELFPVRIDTLEGFRTLTSWQSISTRDGLFWISSLNTGLYVVNPSRKVIPFITIPQANTSFNSFYWDKGAPFSWVGTDGALGKLSMDWKIIKYWQHNPKDPKSLSGELVNSLRKRSDGKFWLATSGGLSLFDPETETFDNYIHDPKNPASIGQGWIMNLFIDHAGNLWLPGRGDGLNMLISGTRQFKHWRMEGKDSNSLASNRVICVAEDRNHQLFVASEGGVDKMIGDNKFKHYLSQNEAQAIFLDAAGVLWCGARRGLFRFDEKKDDFISFQDAGSGPELGRVLNILEDDEKNLWISTAAAILKIDSSRKILTRLGEDYGVKFNTSALEDNFKAADGRLFMGDQEGFYSFYPKDIKEFILPPTLNITGFQIADREILPSANGVLNTHIYETREINLNYHQNVFSFDFPGISFNDVEDQRYAYKLENYDNEWRNTGTEHNAHFFNVPPGDYVFRARVINGDGQVAEKSINIHITPPWWKTWWAYTLFAIAIAGAIWAFVAYRSRALIAENKLLEEKVNTRTAQLKKSFEDLKATQSQLIQSEKMASLGELTAGIAHEIQNPLNFVNNFSEVNVELLREMKESFERGNLPEATQLAQDLQTNMEKITEHGKRADSIVKGMLQHSRTSSGQKEPTDLNALCDEYLRLAYHGLRAKDKSFNAEFKTDFDPSVGQVNLLPQDMGRVLLNLYNNAFYAVKEKSKKQVPGYDPSVSVQTRRLGDRVEIAVHDNGLGIPQKIQDKIFQPFFTTKPTGQGTGLGLSLSYDIVKAQGGEINMESKEGEGTTFVIQLV